MDIRQLKYVLAVAKTGSFAKASKNQYVSRQTLSKAVSDLEEELGFALFLRNYSGVMLTHKGKIFCDRIDSIIEEIEALQRELMVL